ncbi:MAG: hypothetical protein DMG43_08375 [Acidobacteria bacterium]|nr:MAG: hypothetical protein DMG43_08375 [Acidobacteriota bacterium]
MLIFRMILALRSATSLTLYQGELAEKAGLSRNALGLIEQDRRWPRIANVLRISDGLGMTIDDVLKGIQKKKKHRSRAELADVHRSPGPILGSRSRACAVPGAP